jgi:hypothetical protein
MINVLNRSNDYKSSYNYMLSTCGLVLCDKNSDSSYCGKMRLLLNIPVKMKH